MFPPFAQELAHHYCLNLISKLELGTVKLQQIAKPSLDRDGHGVMIGSLVCYNRLLQKRVILYAVSGNYSEFSFTAEYKSDDEEVFVPSLVSPQQISDALAQYDAEIHSLTGKINQMLNQVQHDVASVNQVQHDSVPLPSITELKKRRTQLTDISLKKVFDLYTFTRWDGKKITLNQIIKEHNNKLPPTGTGDCCAPKLLSYAFEHNLEPVSMDEVFYGKNSSTKKCGTSYPPCTERCGYILPYILGLEILYRDSQIIAVNKPSGLLSVPGRGPEKQDCVVNRVKSLFPHCIEQPSVHRLDMETSGILILAFTAQAHKNLSMQFQQGTVQKRYCALLEGILEKATGLTAPSHGEQNGSINLKFRLDVENRPHQIYDETYGKEGITLWEKAGTITYFYPNSSDNECSSEASDISDNSLNSIKKIKATKVIFTPKTGRTHQLRLAASDPHGFGLPIIGDSLYGTKTPGQRLMLHAFEIEFLHPISGQKIKITLPQNI